MRIATSNGSLKNTELVQLRAFRIYVEKVFSCPSFLYIFFGSYVRMYTYGFEKYLYTNIISIRTYPTSIFYMVLHHVAKASFSFFKFSESYGRDIY